MQQTHATHIELNNNIYEAWKLVKRPRLLGINDTHIAFENQNKAIENSLRNIYQKIEIT